MKLTIATSVLLVACSLCSVSAQHGGTDALREPPTLKLPSLYKIMVHNNAMLAAAKAIKKDSGWGTYFKGNPNTQQWGAAVGKKIYESKNGNTELSVGGAIDGKGLKVTAGQAGFIIKQRFK